MRVLAIGGAGYVGSHCVRTLCDRGHDVVVYDNLSTGHRQAVDRRAACVIGDLADAKLLARVMGDGAFDGVMHFAAFLNVDESVRQPLRYYQNNVSSTIRLLQLMEQHPLLRLVFSSTCAIYGVPPALPLTEDTPKDPISPYGRTKLAMEWALQDCSRAWNLGACALRYFNAAGAAQDGAIGEDHDPETHLIPILMQVALGRRPSVQIYGTDYPTPDGSCVRDYVHVDDLADAHVLALQTQQPGEFRCYNVGTGAGTSVQQVVEAARRVTGHPIPALPAPRRAGDPAALCADPGKIMRELGWKPRFGGILSIVETAWNWHRKHPSGYNG